MGLHHDVVCHLEVADQGGSVQDLNAELTLDSVVDLNADSDITETL